MGTRRYTSADQAGGGDQPARHRRSGRRCAQNGPEARNSRVPVPPVDWGRPLRFERRLVPAVAALGSLTLHSIFLFPGWPGLGQALPAAPKLRARRAAFALMIQGSSGPRVDEQEAKANALRPAPPDHTGIERESMAAPRPAEVRPPEADLARTERVTVTDVAGVPQRHSPGVNPVEGGVRSARLLHGPGVPRYPEVCRREGIEGDGEYLLAIDETGRVTGVEVLRSAGHPELDKAARLFLTYRAKYEPATLDGVPVPCTERLVVAFELELR